MCKKIHRGGNAEQYYADKKYKEAVAVAVEACADDPDTTLDDIREAVTTLEETERIARRVLGSSHPRTQDLEETLQEARACFLRAREELGLA